ncbi:MAG: hypothetical protein BWY67_02537 [Bacteroidetes bacterium ADurb.Bin397]|nr:MAG: hypothetical protein BWY67_02537 [Bacteroidetes bacterium ADurb.Bin397]
METIGSGFAVMSIKLEVDAQPFEDAIQRYLPVVFALNEESISDK